MDTNKIETLAKEFSTHKFWKKIRKNSRKIGSELLEKALLLYFVLKKPSVPVWVRGTICGALAYLILPFDAISDFLPIVGYSDDLSVILAALGSVSFYVDDEVRAKAKTTSNRWLGMSLDPKILDEDYIVDPPLKDER